MSHGDALKLAIFMAVILWFIACAAYFDDYSTLLPDRLLTFIVFGIPILLMIGTMIWGFIYSFS